MRRRLCPGHWWTEAADTYSLATITYYLLTGRHPYMGKTPRELFQQLLTQPPTPLNQAVPGLRFGKALERALMRGLAREPGERHDSVTAFAEDIWNAADDTQVDAPSRPGGLIGTLKSILGKRSEA